MGYVCKFCGGAKPPVLVLAPLTGGDPAAACEEDLPIAATMLLADALGLDVDQLYTVVVAEAERQAAAAAAAENAASKPPAESGGKSRPRGQTGRKKTASRATDHPQTGLGGQSQTGAQDTVDAASGHHTTG